MPAADGSHGRSLASSSEPSGIVKCVLFSGYAAANYKLFVFVVSALIGSIGGALFVPQVGIINPSEMETTKSLEAVVWVAVGGRGTLLGPIVGAIAVNWMKSKTTQAFPDLWLIILGGMFVIIVLFLPKGIAGIPAQIKALLAKPQAADLALPIAAPAKPE